MVIRTFTSFVGAPSFIVKVGLHVKKSHSFSIQRTKKYVEEESVLSIVKTHKKLISGYR